MLYIDTYLSYPCVLMVGFYQKERQFHQGDKRKSVRDINPIYFPCIQSRLLSCSFAFLIHTASDTASAPCLHCQCLQTKAGNASALTLLRVCLPKVTVLDTQCYCPMLQSPEEQKWGGDTKFPLVLRWQCLSLSSALHGDIVSWNLS